jgi:hypothetical protein
MKILSIVIAFGFLAATAAAGGLVPARDAARDHASPPHDWDLERVDFVHYAKPAGAGTGGEKCYKLLGVKWKAFPVSYVINPTNPQGLDETWVAAQIASSFETWDASTSIELLADTYSVDSAAAYGVQNFVNAIAFGDHPDSGVIGVTTVWYSLAGRQIVEFDMLLNTDFAWGDASVDATKMDLLNIATHEDGHAVGMGDIYSAACSAVTMYGYSGYGDLNKRTLEPSDIAGLQRMYGA